MEEMFLRKKTHVTEVTCTCGMQPRHTELKIVADSY